MDPNGNTHRELREHTRSKAGELGGEREREAKIQRLGTHKYKVRETMGENGIENATGSWLGAQARASPYIDLENCWGCIAPWLQRRMLQSMQGCNA